jgi:hypothetical protein
MYLETYFDTNTSTTYLYTTSGFSINKYRFEFVNC